MFMHDFPSLEATDFAQKELLFFWVLAICTTAPMTSGTPFIPAAWPHYSRMSIRSG